MKPDIQTSDDMNEPSVGRGAEPLTRSTIISPWILFGREHSLLLFFSVAFLISWVLWFLEAGLRAGDGASAGLLVKIGTYGPVLSAMLVSALANPERTRAVLSVRFLAGGFVLALAIYCQFPTVAQLRSNHGTALGWTLLALSIVLPAFVFFNARSSVRGIRDLLGSLTEWRARPCWFLAALFLMPVISLVGVLITALFTGQPLSHFVSAIQSSETLRHLGPTFLATALYGGPLGEEGGWRGFALPRLQRRFDPLLASVILAALWGFWHLPLHLTGYYRDVFGTPLNGIIQQLLSTFPLAVIFTWLYNRSHGSLLIMVMLHTSINVTSGIVTPAIGLFVSTTVAVVLLVLWDRMHVKLPDSPEPAAR